jgi:alpha-beta hydrolase superfamily lysophospholipase
MVLCAVVSALSITSAGRAQPPHAAPVLWGDLTPGRYAVGYRAEWTFDRSRTWRLTHRAVRAFTPDTAGRPVRIAIWYPSTPDAAATRLHFGDYLHIGAPTEIADFAARLEQRNRNALASAVQPNEVAAVAQMSMFATHHAPAARGRFPLMIALAGLNSEATAQVVLAEFLASHGYVVAILEWTGVTEDQFDAALTQPNVEATLRDVEFAWARLRTRPDVEPGRFTVMGHSLGGVAAVLAAMRNGDVGAAIGLDATYGFAEVADALTGAYDYTPRQMMVPLLDVRRAAGEQTAQLDLRAVHKFIYSDRTFVTLRNVRHGDFSAYSLIASATHQPPLPADRITAGWTRETASARYEQTARMVLDFLDAKLKGDASGVTRLSAEAAASPGAVYSHESAIPPPPSPPEFVVLAKSIGFDSAMRLLAPHAHDSTIDASIDASAYNQLGYSLLSQKRADDATTAFRVVVTTYPSSANGYDSYGDGLSALGRTADACAAYARALALAPSDSTLAPPARAVLITAETERMKGGCPRSP